jgi:hypothetical protein
VFDKVHLTSQRSTDAASIDPHLQFCKMSIKRRKTLFLEIPAWISRGLLYSFKLKKF